MIPNSVMIPLFVAMLILVTSYLWMTFNLFVYLKKRHEALWEELGRPSFFNNSISNNWKFLSFLMSRRYRSVPDSFVQERGKFIFCLFIFTTFLFVSVIIIGEILGTR